MMPTCSLRLANHIACRYDRDDRAKALLVLLVVVLCAWFDSAHAAGKPASEQVYDFDIPRTSRVQAIQELSRQAGGLLLGYLSNDNAEEEALVGPVKGRQSVEDALRIILR